MEHTSSFSHRVATAAFITLLITALFWLIGYAASFFFLVFGGVTLAVVISAMAHFIQHKTSFSYGLSMAMVLLLLVVLIWGIIWGLAPTVSQQADQLAQSLPASVERLKSNLSQTEWGNKLLNGIPQNPGDLLSSGGPGKGVLSEITGVFSGTLSGLINLLIVIITGIYLAFDPGSYRRGFVRLFNPSYRGAAQLIDRPPTFAAIKTTTSTNGIGR